MGDTYLVVALCYVLFGGFVAVFDARRRRHRGADPITVFIVIFMIQCCIAPFAIYSLLPFVDPASPTQREFSDRIYQTTDVTSGLLLVSMAACFVVFFYAGCAAGRVVLRSGPRPEVLRDPKYSISTRKAVLLGIVLAGFALTLWSFYLMGDDLVSRYGNLVLLRAGWEGVERTALNANALSLAQTWSWLAVIALFVVAERGAGERRLATRANIAVFLAVLVVLSLLGASRRAIFLPMLLAYLALTLHSNRWRLWWIVAIAVPLVAWLAYGKELLAGIANSSTVADVLAADSGGWQSALLRGTSDLGITNVESLATFKFLHLPLRFGVDHLLSIAQRLRFQALGFHSDFPQRIVRISTETFLSPDAEDLPPGLFGQMWLDFGVLGPVVWGLVLGLQVAVVQYFHERSRNTLTSSAFFALLVFVIALPVNSGSYDFTFSIDIIVLAMALVACVRVRRATATTGLADSVAVHGGAATQ